MDRNPPPSVIIICRERAAIRHIPDNADLIVAAFADNGDLSDYQICDHADKVIFENVDAGAALLALIDNAKCCAERDREETGPYDRIVSVGMFEHVGVKHYRRARGNVWRRLHWVYV